MNKIIYFLLVVILLTSCSDTVEPSPTATLVPATPTDIPQPTATPEPTLEPSATPPSLPPTIAPPDPNSAGVLPIDQVAIRLPSWLSAYRVDSSPGTAYDPNIPPELNGMPPHLIISFDQDRVNPELFDIFQRQLRVLPVDSFREMYAQAGNQEVTQRIEALQNLLVSRPENIEGSIPVLPGINAVQNLQARVQYLDFTGGSGIAFLTYYTQDRSPLTNENLSYFFQGLTNDGTQYISFVYPITSAGLPSNLDEVSQETMELINQDFASYLEDTTGLLNESAVGDFMPNLDDMNAMLSSLTIGPATLITPTSQPTTTSYPTSTVGTPATLFPTSPVITSTPTSIPSNIVGVNWYWVSLSNPDGSTVTPEDPDRYVLQFNEDGSLSVKADCNTASGTFSLRDKNKLNIDLVSGTTKDCGNGSPSVLFMDMLEEANSYQINQDKLTIRLSNGGDMRFSK